MPKPFSYTQHSSSLSLLTQKIKKASRLAIDTEADSLHNYFEKVCLIQLSFEDQHFIVDPLAGLDLREFFHVLASKPLIFHSADYDLRMLLASFKFQPLAPIFDTMIAAQLLAMNPLVLRRWSSVLWESN